MLDLAGSVVGARHPDASPETSVLRAAAVVAVIDGVSATAQRLDEPTRSALSGEMRRVLGAYLRSL